MINQDNEEEVNTVRCDPMIGFDDHDYTVLYNDLLACFEKLTVFTISPGKITKLILLVYRFKADSSFKVAELGHRDVVKSVG